MRRCRSSPPPHSMQPLPTRLHPRGCSRRMRRHRPPPPASPIHATLPLPMRGSLALTISHCREDAPDAGSRCAGCRGRRCHRPRAEYPPTLSTSTRTLKSSPVSNHQLVCWLQKNEALVVGGRRPTGPGARRRKLPRSTSA